MKQIVLAALLLAPAAFCAQISFVPAGAQLDGDAILDIATVVGNHITFEISINTLDNGAADPFPGNLTDFTYSVDWDSSELKFVGKNLDLGANFGNNFMNPVLGGVVKNSSIEHHLGNVGANQGNFLLDTIEFEVVGLVNDGTFDFRTTAFGATAGGVAAIHWYSVRGAGGIWFPQSQQVEVQPADGGGGGGGDGDEPRVPEPGTLPLALCGGSVLAYTQFSRRARKRRS